MATQNLTGVDALLKNVYRGPLVEQLNQETQIVDILEKTDANNIGTFTGRQIIAPVHSGRNRVAVRSRTGASSRLRERRRRWMRSSR